MSIMGNLAKQICFVCYADKEYDREGWEKKDMCFTDGSLQRKLKVPCWIKFPMANIFISGAGLSSAISVLGEFLPTKPTHSHELLHM